MAAAADTETAQQLRAVLGRLSRSLRPTDAGLAADLTPTRVAVLLTIVRDGPIRLAEVAESEGLNPTMLSRQIAKLAEDGLITRRPDQDDRRSAWLESTPAGSELADRIRDQRTHAVEVALEQLSPEDRRALESALPALEQLSAELKAQPAYTREATG
jgi:DNA-binding MarR family transcriptional regulator